MHRNHPNATPRLPRPRSAFRPICQFLLIVAALLALSGCTATSQYMHPATQQAPLVAPPNAALVVFLRPSGLGRSLMFTVIDSKGRFLGDAQAGSRFAVAVPPGEHVFVTWSENAAPMRANLLPGRVYYVLVNPRMGVWRARVDLLAISPRTGNFGDLKEYLEDTEPLEPDQVQGQAYLASESDDVQENLRQANQELVELDPEELMERTLLPNDGVPSPGAPMPPQGMPLQGMPPQGMPPQGMPPQGMPPQGMQPAAPPPPGPPPTAAQPAPPNSMPPAQPAPPAQTAPPAPVAK